MSISYEVEVKFFVPNLSAVRERIVALGGELKKPRVYERNVVYDRPDGELAGSRRLLRLRKDEKAKLTFKGPADDVQSEAKVREEIEVIVSDFEAMERIILKLGYGPSTVYEKYRETFQIGDVEIVLDDLPYGSFIELEGPEPDIKRLSGDLEIDWEERVLTNYLGLMRELKMAADLPFDDLTFENFAETSVRIEMILGPGIH